MEIFPPILSAEEVTHNGSVNLGEGTSFMNILSRVRLLLILVRLMSYELSGDFLDQRPNPQ